MDLTHVFHRRVVFYGWGQYEKKEKKKKKEEKKKAIKMHYFDRFKCHLNTDRNHYKANFINIVSASETVKQVL